MIEMPVTAPEGQKRQVVTRGRNLVSYCFYSVGYDLYDLYDLKEKKMEKGGYRERWCEAVCAVKVATVVTEVGAEALGFCSTTPALPPSRRVPAPCLAAAPSDAPAPASPCVGTCGLDDAGHCRGCGRTAGEIAGWRDMGDAEKRRVLGRLVARGVDAAGGVL